jgi:hypothetical protein
MEQRCTGGESHQLFPESSYDQVPVCANRHVCRANNERRKASRIWSYTCPLCGQTLAATKADERIMKLSHLRECVQRGNVW